MALNVVRTKRLGIAWLLFATLLWRLRWQNYQKIRAGLKLLMGVSSGKRFPDERKGGGDRARATFDHISLTGRLKQKQEECCFASLVAWHYD